MSWLGFGNKKNVSAVEAEAKPASITLEGAVRFIVENKHQISRGVLTPMAKPSRQVRGQRDKSEKDVIREAVSNTVANLRDKSEKEMMLWVKKLEDKLRIDAMVDAITGDLYSDVIEAARSRAMVKAIRAGLDKSEAFVKLVEEQDLKEIRSIERWIERSNAYQAVTAS